MNESYEKGFSLAEVLISLGIIGIVAMLLTPYLQHQIFKKEMKEKFTVASAVFAQLILEIKRNTDLPSIYDEYSYFTNGYTYVKSCNFNKAVNDVLGQNILNFSNYTIKNYSGNPGTIDVETSMDECTNLIYKKFLLKNGMIYKPTLNWGSIMLFVDLNGVKKPNRLGFDIFTFIIDKNDRLKPFSHASLFDCNTGSSDVRNGYHCTQFAIVDKCPDGSNRSYWDCLPR